MKKLIVSLSLLFTFVFGITAQVFDKQCYYGFNFERSENKNWGYGELVVTSVEPNSPAEVAGIKVNDIIMEINGKATFLRNDATISDWLFDNPNPEVKFTIRNINTHFREYTLNRECITVNSVDENHLASIFSLYSLENTRQQSFDLPLQINPTPDVDFADYHTFAFYNDGNAAPQIDSKIKSILEEKLFAMGMQKDEKDPDIWINLYYEHTLNPNFVGVNDSKASFFTQRFNVANKKMENYPIYDPKTEKINVKGQYIIELGFTFYDKKYIDPSNYTQIWECNLKDYLSDNLTLEEYAELHVPLIMMQYPYSTPKHESKYLVDFNKHNYTGIHFDADNMGQVNDMDIDSPAYVAGVRPGYKIEKIDKKKFNYTTDEISDGYKKFITDTEQYRDPNSAFSGMEGYKCMFWKPNSYSDIAKKFKESQYLTNFSYLYDFESYVNPNYSGSLNIEVWDGIQKRIFIVYPQIREYTTIKAL